MNQISNATELTGSIQDFEDNPLKQAVRGLTNALRLDYGSLFSGQFSKQTMSVNMWQHRLYHKLCAENVAPGDVIAGYEDHTKQPEAKMPDIPTLVNIARQAKLARLRKMRELEHAEELSSLPPPQFERVQEGIQAVVKQAALSSATKPESVRQENLTKLLATHENLLAVHRASGLLRKTAVAERTCSYHGCRKFGSISSSTKGGEAWFCGEHYR